jgi:hypothetical protein
MDYTAVWMIRQAILDRIVVLFAYDNQFLGPYVDVLSDHGALVFPNKNVHQGILVRQCLEDCYQLCYGQLVLHFVSFVRLVWMDYTSTTAVRQAILDLFGQPFWTLNGHLISLEHAKTSRF